MSNTESTGRRREIRYFEKEKVLIMGAFKENTSNIVGTFATLLAASCCVGPTIFVVFGASVGSLGFSGVLAPYRPIFLLIGYVAIGYSLYKFYLKDYFKEKLLKKPRIQCACEEPTWINKFSRVTTWVAFVLLVIATVYPYMLVKIYS